MKREDVIFIERQNCLVAKISADIDHHNAESLRGEIDSKIFYLRPEQLILDFSGVEFMDSSGLGLILGRAEVASAVGASVKLTGLTDRHKRLIRLAGLERIKNLTITANDA